MGSNPRLTAQERQKIEDEILQLSGVNNSDGRNSGKIAFLQRMLTANSKAQERDREKGRHSVHR